MAVTLMGFQTDRGEAMAMESELRWLSSMRLLGRMAIGRRSRISLQLG